MTLVIEPTLSLMYDQVDKLQLRGIQAASINSAMPAYERSRTLEYIAKGKVKILFVTPERLHNPKFLEAIQDIKISMIAVDERHCVTLWGMVSGLIIWRLEHLLTVSPHKPVIAALTATAASDMRLQICKLLSMDQPKIFVNSLYRPKGSVERLL